MLTKGDDLESEGLCVTVEVVVVVVEEVEEVNAVGEEGVEARLEEKSSVDETVVIAWGDSLGGEGMFFLLGTIIWGRRRISHTTT
jgi:hypothetical protein